VTSWLWIVPPKIPIAFVSTRSDAYEHGLRAYDEARILLQPDVRTSLTRRIGEKRK